MQKMCHIIMYLLYALLLTSDKLTDKLTWLSSRMKCSAPDHKVKGNRCRRQCGHLLISGLIIPTFICLPRPPLQGLVISKIQRTPNFPKDIVTRWLHGLNVLTINHLDYWLRTRP